MTQEERQKQNRLGKILAGAGVAWGALFILSNMVDAGGTPLGNVLSFFGDSLFFPVALIFSGRAVNRRSRRPTVTETLERATRETTSRKPQPGPVSRPRPTSQAPARPAPKAAPPIAQPDVDELAAALGIEEPSGKSKKAVEPDMPADKSVAGSEHTPKTSDEMIAEAREQFDENQP